MKIAIIAIVTVWMVAVNSMASSSIVFEDNFNNLPENGVVLQPDLRNGWLVSVKAVPWYSRTVGTGKSGGIFLRNSNSYMRKFIDLTSAATISRDFRLTFDCWVETSTRDGSEAGYVAITTDSGATWTTNFTLSITSPINVDYNSPGYTGPFTINIDASGWTAEQLAGFGFQFSQKAGQNADHFNVDNVQLSVVPESVTVGMFGLGSLVAPLLIRRRLMR